MHFCVPHTISGSISNQEEIHLNSHHFFVLLNNCILWRQEKLLTYSQVTWASISWRRNKSNTSSRAPTLVKKRTQHQPASPSKSCLIKNRHGFSCSYFLGPFLPKKPSFTNTFSEKTFVYIRASFVFFSSSFSVLFLGRTRRSPGQYLHTQWVV